MTDFAAKIQSLVLEFDALDTKIKTEKRQPSEEEAARCEAIGKEITEAQSHLASLSRVENAALAVANAKEFLVKPSGRRPARSANFSDDPDEVRAEVRKPRGRVAAWPGDPDAPAKALRLGHFVLASAGRGQSIAWCQKNGIPLQHGARIPEAMSHLESSDQHGGIFVPTQIDDDMIDLRYMYGKARQFARTIVMNSDRMTRRRRVAGLRAYFVGEIEAPTRSRKKWDWITLTAKDVAAVATYSKNLDDDAVMNLGDDLAEELAYAFAQLEDECLFLGDGTGTYGGIMGLSPAFKKIASDLALTNADVAGLVTAAGATWASVTLANLQECIARLPEFGDTPNTRWFTHRVFFYGVMVPLKLAAGGVLPSDIGGGANAREMLGYNVEFTNTMPKVTGSAQIPAYLGDMKKTVDFGDRRQTTIAIFGEATIAGESMAETRQNAVYAYERYDINCHDLGNASATAALREPGPLVGLITQ